MTYTSYISGENHSILPVVEGRELDMCTGAGPEIEG